ncbi:Nudix hydrolase 9 [Hordeum vulgare]|nr:Nudix hydrolase 9 [Hordeum vulgare]
MGIKLFIYTLSKTTVNFRMLFPKQPTNDYLANYPMRVEATKVKVYSSYYHDNGLEVFLKAVKDGRVIVTRGWTKVVCAYGMQEGTLWAFRFSNTIGN